jgi:nucleoside-diphosphate kinase
LSQRTLSIIKPDAVAKANIGHIITRLEGEGFTVAAMKLVRLSHEAAQGFYRVHRLKPFFSGLCDFMSSGPCVALVLEADNVISRLRDVMGSTDPARAAEGTIRKQFGSSVERNAIHGSDGPQTARFEIEYLFPELAS